MCCPSCTAHSLALARAYTRVSRNTHCCHSFSRKILQLHQLESVLTPKGTLWCFLHCCQANRGLFSRTSSKTAAATKLCHNRKPSTGPSWMPQLHVLLPDTSCSCRGFSCCSASSLHHILCVTGPQPCPKKARKYCDTSATLPVCNAAGGVSTP